MRKIIISLGVLVVLIAVAKLALQMALPSYTVHYKVTVEIETPEGVKSGSSVWELSVGTPLIDFPDSGNPASRRGEAVVVDLGKRGLVFTVFSNQSWENGLYQAFPTEAPSSKRGIEYYKRTLKVGMKGEWKEYQPGMVTFTDLNDPKSVKGVNKENMSETFGAGVKLKQISVEITDDPVTWDLVEKYLPKNFELNIKEIWSQLSDKEKYRLVLLFNLRKGYGK